MVAVTGKRRLMMIAALGLKGLKKGRLMHWVAPDGPLFEHHPDYGEHLARTQAINWALKRQWLYGTRKGRGLEGIRFVQPTPAGISIATQLLLNLAQCPECEGDALEICEDEDATLYLGCPGCEGMFTGQVVAKHYLTTEQRPKLKGMVLLDLPEVPFDGPLF